MENNERLTEALYSELPQKQGQKRTKSKTRSTRQFCLTQKHNEYKVVYLTGRQLYSSFFLTTFEVSSVSQFKNKN